MNRNGQCPNCGASFQLPPRFCGIARLKCAHCKYFIIVGSRTPPDPTATRFAGGPRVKRPRRRINRTAIVSAVFAASAGSLWLVAMLNLAGIFAAQSIVSLVSAFAGSVFGGMTASSQTGVDRFRHSLYAGAWAFVAQVVFVVPLVFVTQVFVAAASLSDKSLDQVTRDTAATWLESYRSTDSTGATGLLLPVITISGFLVGGMIDLVLTRLSRVLVGASSGRTTPEGASPFQSTGHGAIRLSPSLGA